MEMIKEFTEESVKAFLKDAWEEGFIPFAEACTKLANEIKGDKARFKIVAESVLEMREYTFDEEVIEFIETFNNNLHRETMRDIIYVAFETDIDMNGNHYCKRFLGVSKSERVMVCAIKKQFDLSDEDVRKLWLNRELDLDGRRGVCFSEQLDGVLFRHEGFKQ